MNNIDMCFIKKEKMRSVFNCEAFSVIPNKLYDFFLNNESEIIYITLNENLQGVISIGDLERFYMYNKKLEINKNFISLKSIDYERAGILFEKIPTINEVPVVLQTGEFLGVITYNKDIFLRDEQREKLRKSYRLTWYREETKRLMELVKAPIYVFGIDGDKVKQKYFGITEKAVEAKRKERAAQNLGFLGLTNTEWRTFWGEDYYEGIEEQTEKELSQLQVCGNRGSYVIKDFRGEIYHFDKGNRETTGTPPNTQRNIFMYGPCLVAGGYCTNERTIASYLQNEIKRAGYNSWKVYNKGLCGPDNCINRAFTERYSEDDILILILTDGYVPSEYNTGRGIIDLTDVFMNIENITDNVADCVVHCNGVVNEKIAFAVFNYLAQTGALETQITRNAMLAIQDYYIPWEIKSYFMDFIRKYELKTGLDLEDIVGAVVVNCNPFTRGHRHLIEQALNFVDKLYVFVVEEDASFFKFKDRFEMVKRGIKDLERVQVIPSGKYIISNDTFEQYFKKEQVQVIESMDYDIQIFGDVLVRELGIKYRFVGEEPFDKVTREYNETMKRILPQFGVKVVEIPRKTIVIGGNIISATSVREAIYNKDNNLINELCPETTVSYLKEKGYVI